MMGQKESLSIQKERTRPNSAENFWILWNTSAPQQMRLHKRQKAKESREYTEGLKKSSLLKKRGETYAEMGRISLCQGRWLE